MAQGCYKELQSIGSVSTDREVNSRILSRLRSLLLPFTATQPTGQQEQKRSDASTDKQSFFMSAPSNESDPLRAELDRLQQMLEENRVNCAQAKMRLEARAAAKKDGEGGWDQFYAEIRGKLHSLMEDSRENRSSRKPKRFSLWVFISDIE
ncbi:hypothetical protein BDR03DRAFT_956298 [Suillus americanus]|nr:hypothetical protein BDR03DRAFT_956298 [Suillus americanus]